MGRDLPDAIHNDSSQSDGIHTTSLYLRQDCASLVLGQSVQIGYCMVF